MAEITDRPLVTFFVMAYNQEKYVREAILGAFSQTYQPMEIIISDDCSTDRTFKIMEEMVKSYRGPHQIILNKNTENLGICAHIDKIMNMSKGNLIIQNAGDDISCPERTCNLVNCWLKSSYKVKLIHSASARIDDYSKRIRGYRPSSLMIKHPTAFNIVKERLSVSGATLAWDRELFEVYGPLGSELGVEDFILCFRAALLGEIAYLDKELVDWRAGGESWTPLGVTTWDRLYGVGLRVAQWRLQDSIHILKNFSERDYFDKEKIEKICRDRADHYGLIVEIAESTFTGRVARLPRVLSQVFKQKSPYLLRIWLKYTLDKAYIFFNDNNSDQKT